MQTGNSMPQRRSSRFYLWIMRLIELLISFSIFVVFFNVLRFDFAAIGTIFLPLVVAMFSFTSLLYNRARAYGKSRSRTRSLYAAERAMQGAFFTLLSGLLGVGMYGAFVYCGFASGEPTQAKHLWLLLFFIPVLLLVPGVVCFLLAVRSASVDFLGPRSPWELRKRIREGGG